MSAPGLDAMRAYEEGILVYMEYLRAEGRHTGHFSDLLAEVRYEMRENYPCQECRGSGVVAYSPWGSRPPKMTCLVCKGTRILTEDAGV